MVSQLYLHTTEAPRHCDLVFQNHTLGEKLYRFLGKNEKSIRFLKLGDLVVRDFMTKSYLFASRSSSPFSLVSSLLFAVFLHQVFLFRSLNTVCLSHGDGGIPWGSVNPPKSINQSTTSTTRRLHFLVYLRDFECHDAAYAANTLWPPAWQLASEELYSTYTRVQQAAGA